MISDKIFVFILLIHFLADFGLQTNDQAINKSSSNIFLFYHVGVYSLIWLIASYIIFLNVIMAILFSLITFLFHFGTDWVTSRVGKPFWSKGDYHNGFAVVGFDQLLHYIQLYYTFRILLSYEF